MCVAPHGSGLESLNKLSFSVSKGESVGVIGPNGAGKTTLFNVISGFIEPDDGRGKLGENDVIGLPPERIEKLGLTRTFQIVNVFNNLTPEENILIGSTNEILIFFMIYFQF